MARVCNATGRHPFQIVIDETQNFGPGVITTLLTDAHKFAVGVTIAKQFLDRLDRDVGVHGPVSLRCVLNCRQPPRRTLRKAVATSLRLLCHANTPTSSRVFSPIGALGAKSAVCGLGSHPPKNVVYR
jgi:hypothetical protein